MKTKARFASWFAKATSFNSQNLSPSLPKIIPANRATKMTGILFLSRNTAEMITAESIRGIGQINNIG
jgi:hypothetical protein